MTTSAATETSPSRARRPGDLRWSSAVTPAMGSSTASALGGSAAAGSASVGSSATSGSGGPGLEDVGGGDARRTVAVDEELGAEGQLEVVRRQGEERREAAVRPRVGSG